MYFTTYRSPLPIVIINTIVINWCLLENFYVGGELLHVINIKSSNDGGFQMSFIIYEDFLPEKIISENCQIHLTFP